MDFVSETVEINVPLEVLTESLSNGAVIPRMVVTDAAISAALIRALVSQITDEAVDVEKIYRDHKKVDSTVDSVAEMRTQLRKLSFSVSALYLTLTNAQVIITTEDML